LIEQKKQDNYELIVGGVMTAWHRIGQYEYEYNEKGYTGWCRCVGGRLAEGTWPKFK
jgi:hypothetical protein